MNTFIFIFFDNCLFGDIMKKFFCILLIISILLLPFCSLPASALGVEDALEYFLGWFIDTSLNISDGTNGVGTDLINWYNSPEGQIYLTYLKTNPFFKQYGDYLSGYVQDANNSWYSVAQLKKEQVDELFDTINGYWTSDSAPIRSVTLSSIGVNTFEYNVHYCGYLRGTNGILSTDPRDDKNATFYSEYDSTTPTGTIFVYSGSTRFPPVITTGAGTSIGISGFESGAVGQFVILNSSGDSFYLDKTWLSSGLQFYYINGEPDHFDARRNSWIWPQLWTSGTKLNEYTDFDAPYALDLFTKSIGLHICQDISSPVPQPDAIPYDSDDNIVVLVPLSEPSEPVYLAPNVFNNYLADNTYMTYNEGDTVVNNVTNDTMIQEFNNVYNNTTNNNTSGGDGSSYDDTNLINRLSNWFSSVISKLDEIINKMPPSSNNTPVSSDYDSETDIETDSDDEFTYSTWLPPWLSWLDPDPCYDKFSDCIFENVPLFALASDTLTALQNGINSSDDDKTPVLSGGDVNGDVDNTFNGVTADNIANYVDYNNYVGSFIKNIRPVTSFLAYALGVMSVWRSIKSLFGINVDLSDASGVFSSMIRESSRDSKIHPD